MVGWLRAVERERGYEVARLIEGGKEYGSVLFKSVVDVAEEPIRCAWFVFLVFSFRASWAGRKVGDQGSSRRPIVCLEGKEVICLAVMN